MLIKIKSLPKSIQEHPTFSIPIRDYERELIMTAALDCNEGRKTLAEAMVEPIKRSLEYRAIGRKLLLDD